MKTSNKILLILGLALLVSPLLFTSFYVNAHYEKRDLESYKSIDRKSPGMISISTKAFKTIIYKGGILNAYVTINIINSEKFGIKIPEGLKEITSAKVNGQGELEIITEHKFKNNPLIVFDIYAPKNTGLSVYGVATKTDVNIQSESFLFMATDCVTKILVENNNISGLGIQDMNLILKNSRVDFRTEKLNSLVIHASGNSKVECRHNYDESDSLKVNKLELNLHDKSEFSVKNLIANSIVGYVAETAKLYGIDRSEIKKP